MKRVKSAVLIGVLILTGFIGSYRVQAAEYLTVIDFIATANKAKWRSSFGEQPFPGKTGSRTGSALWIYNSALENGTQYALLLQTSPDIQEKGYIIGTYSDVTIPERARLNTEFGFLVNGSNTEGVTFSVSFQVGRTRATPLFEKFKYFNRQTEKIIVDLTDFANQTGVIQIKVSGVNPSLDDLAAWSKMVLEVEKIEKGPPDLIVSSIVAEDRKVNYTVKNIGKSPTPYLRRGQSIDTILTLNGKEVAMDKMNTVLDPQEEITRTFPDYMLPDTKADQTLLVCTDTAFVVEETDEKNNCLQIRMKTEPIDEHPDLLITMIQVTLGKVSYTIKNIGKGAASKIQRGKLFQTSLSLDGKQVSVDTLGGILQPGEEVTHVFTDFLIPTSTEEQLLLVCADSDDAFVETDERNNCMVKKIPPVPQEEDLHFVSLPQASQISSRSVTIVWETNIVSNSHVLYDSRFNQFTLHVQDRGLVQTHSITLSQLKPETVYQFYVRSEDQKGSLIQSKGVYFKTMPERMNANPTLRFSIPNELSGMIKILPVISHVTHFSRIQLLVDDQLFISNYSGPFEMAFDTKKLSNGLHEFTLRGIDKNGNRLIEKKTGEVVNQDIKLNKGPVITFVTPVNLTEFPNTTAKIPIKAIVDHKLKFSIRTIDILIDGNLAVTVMPSMKKGCWAIGEELPKTFEYDLPIERFTSGQHVVSLRISDNQQVETSAERTIMTHTPIWAKPALFVSYKTSSTPLKTGYRVDLTVTNLGNVKAKDITLQIKQDLLPGFLISNIDKPVKYQLMTGYVQAMEIHIPELDFQPSNREWHLLFDMTPILTQEVDLDEYVIMNHAAIIYDWIDNPSKPSWENISLSKLAAFDTMLMFFNADYLIVSNITNLLLPYQNPNHPLRNTVYFLLDQMGQLAVNKQGVIGLFTDPYLSAEQVKDKISTWSGYLTNEFRSEGYLLLIGETEIIPSYSFIISRKNYSLTVPSSDFPFADAAGLEIIPELHIGRIIGNDPERLAKPIQASVDIVKKKANFFRKKHPLSSAYCVSGFGEGEGKFWQSAYQIGEILKQEYATVTQDRGEAFVNLGIPIWQRINENASKGISILFWRDHGRSDGWGDYESSADSFYKSAAFAGNLNFGDMRPFIFASCCDSGQYEGIYGIAECMLEKAGAYIGSTSLSDRNANNEFAAIFFNRWINRANVSFGAAFRETRVFAYKNIFWSAEYQFYGDPKFGVEIP